MKGRKNRADPERFFPKGESTLEGALKKMSYMRSNTEIQIGTPLKLQIFSLIESSPEGLTVQEISSRLALNTKTCAKVLDEMLFKHQELKATAHRYGRVFVHKYHVISQPDSVEPECALDLPQELAEEIKAVEGSVGEAIKSAISQSLKEEKKQSRQRITEQSYIRALFVVARIQKLKVCSVYDIKEMIRNELEPNAKWCLDKKTVLRIIWKLRNHGLVKELCFRIRLRKDDDHEVMYIGNHYDCIVDDKKLNKSNNVIYKLLAALPEIMENDPLVLDCPAIKNPTNRKPFTVSTTATKPVMNIKSRVIRDIALVQNAAYKKVKGNGGANSVVEGILVMQSVIEDKEVEISEGSILLLSRAYSLAIFVKSMFRILELKVFTRYNFLFKYFRMPLCYTALKEFVNKNRKTVKEKYSFAYSSFSFKKNAEVSPTLGEIERFPCVALPKKRKHTLEEMNFQIQKIFLVLEKKPDVLTDEGVKRLGKGVDTDPVYMMKYLSDLGFTKKRGDYWEVENLF